MSQRLRQRLIDAMQEMPVIDAHEHVPPESERLAMDVDVLTLFSHYTQTDLESAGMTQEQYDRTQDTSVPLDERWELFVPFYERMKFGSYARAARIAARHFYGADIGPDTYQAISERMKQANKPGLYRRVIRDACNIKVCLTQIGRIPERNKGLLVPVLPIASLTGGGEVAAMQKSAEAVGVELKMLADYDEVLDGLLADFKRKGVVGFKTMSRELADPTPGAAVQAFQEGLKGRSYDRALLDAYLTHRAFDAIGAADLVVAVHCGIIWDNWNNFYALHPRNMVPKLLKHRNTRFDLYHAAIPWVREIAIIAKELPNAYLNMCWCHVISQQMSISALDEWLDLVPVNKIIGFGGDYHRPVEKIYGHLVMAREDIAAVLARRVGDKQMTFGEAVSLARMLLFDNPRELYRLDV